MPYYECYGSPFKGDRLKKERDAKAKASYAKAHKRRKQRK